MEDFKKMRKKKKLTQKYVAEKALIQKIMQYAQSFILN